MKQLRKGLIGLVLVVVGITLFLRDMPTIGGTVTSVEDYCWALGITVLTCLGFGLMVISVFGAE